MPVHFLSSDEETKLSTSESRVSAFIRWIWSSYTYTIC